MDQKRPSLRRSILISLGILAALVTYAYGFQVTKVNLAETKSEHRQQQLFRILRALAQPNIFEYDQEEFRVTLPIMSPCPPEGFTPPAPEPTQAYMIAAPSCADPRSQVELEGFNFEPLTRGPVNFVPADSDVSLQMASIEIDSDGHFEATIRIPNRPNDEPHSLVAITRRNIGAPRLTQTAYDTWDKIVETVFLALLATTLGTFFAVPLSFFAARNLMSDITSTLIGASLSVILIPIGLFIGANFALAARLLSSVLTLHILLAIGALIVIPIVASFGFRWALPQRESGPTPTLSVRLGRIVVLILLAFFSILALYLISSIMIDLGEQAAGPLGGLGFLGRFVRDLGDILGIAIPPIAALGGAGLFSSFAGRVGTAMGNLESAVVKVLHYLLATLAGAALLFMVAATVNWFYQFIDPNTFYLRMTTVGGVLGLALSLFVKPATPVPIGMVIYFASRTIFNALRSIEALVMAIVFVVWVGIGPFAGSLALALHTIAALSKLYSEQVESIMDGPIEAVQATGANRLQTIVYAVIPQIIPPYISFTMYRWDINVRMSTIIGFAGGGGIGFLLQQNINLLNYRDASAQMLAIAIVVAAMDYISANLRERFV